MDAKTVERYIGAIGKTYESLLSQETLPSTKPWKIFETDDQFSVDIEEGLSLTFSEETRRLESVFITIIQTTPSTTSYKGEMPRPFTPSMNQATVRATFGEPMASKGPINMPKPMGMTGGWDAYQFDPVTHPNVKVVFQYTAASMVNTLVFSLIDKDHD